MNAIEFKNVRFSYEESESVANGAKTEDAFCIKGVDFCVREGEFVAVLGHNGSGKSTLARLTNGLLTPTEGEVLVSGLSTKDKKNLFEIRKNVGIVFQNPDNQTVATIVEDDVAFGPENVGIEREEIGKRILFALGAVGMEEYRNATTTRLSGGQKQRIAIASVLALKPKIMIFDESTAMLDPKGRKEVIDVVCKLNKEEGITVLLITHFPEEAMLADRAVVMKDGLIVKEGAPSEVLSCEEELNECFLTLPKPFKVCKKLRSLGVLVGDTLSEKEIAKKIAEKGISSYKEEKDEEKAENSEESGRIYCENLSYTYNAKSPFETHALNGVSLEIKSGEFFGILGHTGSGKSTFVQHLNGLIKLPTAQKKYKKRRKKQPFEDIKLTVSGYDLSDKKTDFKQLRSKIGMVFQYPEYQLFAETVFEDVAFGLKNFSTKQLTDEEIKVAVQDALETVGLDYETYKNRSPFELSGGQKRRVAIAGVLVTKPEILVLDEPAAGLDPVGKEEIMSLLHEVHQKWCKTVIIVSHDMDEIAENCTRAACFADGKISAVGTPKEIFSSVEGLSKAEQAGLELPFIGRIEKELFAFGIDLSSDLTTVDFLRKISQALGAGQEFNGGGGV